MTKESALITGASAGIGAVFARAIAARGTDVILVARRAETLRELADELSRRHGVRAETLAIDLAEVDAGARLHEAVSRLELPVGLLVNNAGFGQWGGFDEADPDRLRRLVLLNVLTLTDLTRRFLPAMKARGRGAVINVASVVAFQAVPYMAAYAASKAYVLSLSEALAEELAGSGVVVQALCPGTTRTAFFEVAGMAEDARGDFMSPEDVVAESLAALASGRPMVVPGLKNRLMVHGGRCLPRAVLTRVAGRLNRPGPADQSTLNS